MRLNAIPARPLRRAVALAVTVGLLAASCSDSDSDSTPDGATSATVAGGAVGEPTTGFLTDQPPGDPEPTITRADVDAALGQLDAVVEGVLDATGVPGMSVAIVYRDEVVFADGFGVRQIGTAEAVDADTVFALASLSKPVSSTVIAGLVGDGHLDWDDPIVEHDPGFALEDPWVSERVTIADLYSHRSGLPDHAGDLLEDLGYDRDDIFERLRLEPLDGFRSTYAYTNFGLSAAAVAAANAAGLTWEEAADQVLFSPAGMGSTSARNTNLLARDNRAIPHRRSDEGGWVPNEEPRDPDAQSPAGGVSSSASDMATWLRIQLADGSLGGDQVIDADALAATRVPHITSAAPRSPSAMSAFYGLGIGVGYDRGRTVLSHSGAFLLGSGTNVVMLPGEQLGIVTLTNAAPVGAAESVSQIFLDLVLEGEVTRDWLALYGPVLEQLYLPQTETDVSTPPEDPTPARDDAAYVGTYLNFYYGSMVVFTGDDGELTMRLGPNDDEFALTHFDADTFTFVPPGENSVGPTPLAFTVGDDDTATALRVEFYDEVGYGSWNLAG